MKTTSGLGALTIAVAGFIACASPASASVVTYTITGTVQYGYDNANLFASGNDLTGNPFQVVEIFDPSLAKSSFTQSTQSGANGGASSGAPGFARVSVSINQGSTALSDSSSNMYSRAGGEIDENVQSGSGSSYAYVGFSLYSDLVKGDYTTPVTIGDFKDWSVGNFQSYDVSGKLTTYANFDVTQLVVTNGSLSAVPLPASMPLFGASILALALVGHGVRRRKTSPMILARARSRRV